ncbi:MAG: hypothetical protein IJ726_08050 [Phocaeicola sp.]|nr:hypothetical protein [Phocaeicola sp.]
MVEVINRLVKRLKIEFVLVWVLVLLLVVFYETGLLDEGLFVGNVRMDYILMTIGILLTVTSIPLSLHLFNFNLVKRISKLSTFEALKSYRYWSEVRLSLLLVAALLNMSFYYLTLNTTGLFCSLMALLATFFCIPSKKRLLKELTLDDISI